MTTSPCRASGCRSGRRGLQALRDLKQLASRKGVAQDEDVAGRRARAEERAKREAATVARAEKVKALQTRFNALSVSAENPQARGYSLEDIVAELFEIEEIPYRRPYKTETEQIDGSFNWRGFDYLVEARWRRGPPNEADLGAFKTKVDKKISITRGLFVSVVGSEPKSLRSSREVSLRTSSCLTVWT